MIPSVPPLSKFIGSRVRERRKKLDWTLEILASKLGLSHQQVQKYEQGVAHLSAERLHELANVLGVSITYFYQGYEIEKNDNPEMQLDTISFQRKTPLQVLIVESDPVDELHTKEILYDCIKDLRIYVLHTGQQVLDLLIRDSYKSKNFPRPDIIFMELSLPQVDGMQVLKELKRDKDLKEIPVIILSNNLSKRLLIECYKNHASGYVRKAFDYDFFKDQLHRTISYWSNICLPRM